MKLKKHILVAPLNWGLGHTTRCIPIINELIVQGFEPVIASDGEALLLLKKEYPEIKTIELPSYNISYPKNGKYFKLKFLKNSIQIFNVIKRENKVVNNIIKDYNIEGIISDNRLGVYSLKAPSVYITHQLNVLSGNTTLFSTKLHQDYIKKFDECWIPDVATNPNLSGILGHKTRHSLNIKYTGILSRFKRIDTKIEYDLLVLLSGPEPQRTLLEKKLLEQLKSYHGKILFIKGKVEEKQIIAKQNQITIYNFMQSKALEIAIQQSKLVLARSGYTTIMDLAKLQKKAFFIPTPGQYEQEYLAQKLNSEGIAPYSSQGAFSAEMLNTIESYTGFIGFNCETNLSALFSLFKRERKLATHI